MLSAVSGERMSKHKLKDALTEAGLTVTQAAKLVGVDRVSLSYIAHGRKHASLKLALKLAALVEGRVRAEELVSPTRRLELAELRARGAA